MGIGTNVQIPQKMSERKIKAGLGFLLVGACSLYLIWDFPQSYSAQALVALGVSAVILECLSPKLSGWGYQSCGVGVYAALGVTSGLSPALAQIVMLNSLLIRMGVRGRSHKFGPLWDYLLDALPLSLFLVCLKLLHPFKAGWVLSVGCFAAMVALTPLLLLREVPPVVRLSKKTLVPLISSMAIIGLYWPLESSSLIPGVLLYSMLVYGAWELARTRTVSREELAETHLGLVKDSQDKLYREIDRKSDLASHQARNRKLLEAIQKNFVNAVSFKQALSALLRLVDGLFSPRSTVLFLCRDGELRPYLFRSPDTRALEGAELTDLKEPLAEACWRENRPMSRRRREWPAKLLPEERSVAVAPIPGYGVLYLGHSTDLFKSPQVETLSLVGRQASYLMQSLAQRVAQKQQIAFVSDEKRRLGLWASRLKQLLRVSQRLSECKSSVEVYSSLEERFSSLIPHHYFAAVGGAEEPIEYSEEEHWNKEAVRALVGRVARDGRPLLLNAIPSKDLVPVEGASAVLLVPMNRLKIALMLVECQESNSYSQEHLDLVLMLGQLAESALLRIRLQEEYLAASKAAAIGQMAAALSHELNTPLGVIQLEMEMAGTFLESSPGKAERHLERAEQALDTSQKILSALLYYTTSYAVVHELMDLKEVLTELVRELDRHSVRLQCEGGNFQLKAFRMDLEQLLRQLLHNAIEASENREHPQVLVRLRDQGEHLQVEVRDNGTGIKEEIRERIFEPFFTTKPVGRGLGLGLSIASQIARLHKGSLVLDSSSSEGSCFVLRLPRSLEAE